MDQPAGTGYSYVNKNDDVRELADAAHHVVTFLENFYRIFPEFSNMDVRFFPFSRPEPELTRSSAQTYIAGESYAGQYIPYIADAILKTTSLRTQLKGLLIGNGWISPRHQYPAYLTYLVDNDFLRKGSQEYRNVQASIAGCHRKIAQMDAKSPGSKGLVLVAECEAILGAMSAATMKECVSLPFPRFSSPLC